MSTPSKGRQFFARRRLSTTGEPMLVIFTVVMAALILAAVLRVVLPG